MGHTRKPLSKEENGVTIRVHPELIEILEKLRLRLSELTYQVISDNASYYQLTGILAKKVGKKI